LIESVWPRSGTDSRFDRFALTLRRLPGFCNICGRITLFEVTSPNFREHVPCGHCRSVNRHRQIASVLLSWAVAQGGEPGRFASLKNLPDGLVVWNTEATRALNGGLRDRLGPTCISSEFLDPALPSGTMRDGILHADIQNSHFQDDSIDYILSSDVMEHVPHVEAALADTYRVLRTGGAHIFTAPFYQHRFSTEKRAVMAADGQIRHLLHPWYHDDPVRAEGVLCFNVFAPELLVAIENTGFEAHLLMLHSPFHGILGANGIVVVARKVKTPGHRVDRIFPGKPSV
jgi:hypothetical protein